MAGRDDVLGRLHLLDVELEDRVEDVVLGEVVRVALVVAKFGAGRPLDGVRGDELAAGVDDLLRDAVDERLGHVGQHVEPARHVAVERRVSRGELALVAGRQQQVALLVGDRHENDAARSAVGRGALHACLVEDLLLHRLQLSQRSDVRVHQVGRHRVVQLERLRSGLGFCGQLDDLRA